MFQVSKINVKQKYVNYIYRINNDNYYKITFLGI